MKEIAARNVHEAFPIAIDLLKQEGVERDSRAGKVLQLKTAVVTEYARPAERVLFWPQRDANPFLHLYESLWMLSGRRDLEPLLKFTKNFIKFSDDGETIHDAYGFRWRYTFEMDQLEIIIDILRSNPLDRRCVLQMWDANQDLGKGGLAFPCNLIATFQIDHNGKLDLTVFCRSNDIIWGCYGANAVHFSMLLEYMARMIDKPMGIYRQISVNWHGYLDTLNKIGPLCKNDWHSPYRKNVHYIPFSIDNNFHYFLDHLMLYVDNGSNMSIKLPKVRNDWQDMLLCMMRAHNIFKNSAAPEKYTRAIALLDEFNGQFPIDWIVAGREWLQRRFYLWERKMGVIHI